MVAELEELAASDLLKLHAGAVEELRRRGVLRSGNNPTGDYAEHLFCRAFGWRQLTQSAKGADAVGGDGTRYQVKGRRMTRHNASRQLGVLRELPDRQFDVLAAVLFAEDFGVHRAALVPHALVLERAKFVERTNSWRFLLRDEVWGWPGVRDVTRELARALGADGLGGAGRAG